MATQDAWDNLRNDVHEMQDLWGTWVHAGDSANREQNGSAMDAEDCCRAFMGQGLAWGTLGEDPMDTSYYCGFYRHRHWPRPWQEAEEAAIIQRLRASVREKEPRGSKLAFRNHLRREVERVRKIQDALLELEALVDKV